MDSINDNILIEIISHLDAISIVRFLSVSKTFWQHRTNTQIVTRIQPYQNIIKYEMWNEGAMLSVKKNHLAQFAWFEERITDYFTWNSCLSAAAFRGNRQIVDYITITLERSRFTEAIVPAAQGGHTQYVDELIQRDGGDWGGNWSYQAIMAAARGGHVELIQFMLAKYPEHWRSWYWKEVIEKATARGHKNVENLLQ